MTITEQALQLLQKTEATVASNAALIAATTGLTGLVALDAQIKVSDFESKFPNRRRAIGCMSTDFIGPFAKFAAINAQEGATVFVDATSMTAKAVLNFGTIEKPGHCDNRTEVSLKGSAAYKAMLTLANHQHDQRSLSEWLEEWGHILKVREGIEETSTEIELAACINAVRNVTIETAKKAESSVGNFSQNLSTAEKIALQAKEDAKLPPFLHLNFAPYKELPDRKFVLRVSAITSRDTPAFRLQILQLEQHQEEMANEFADAVRAAFAELEMPEGKAVPEVLLGSYTKQ